MKSRRTEIGAERYENFCGWTFGGHSSIQSGRGRWQMAGAAESLQRSTIEMAERVIM